VTFEATIENGESMFAVGDGVLAPHVGAFRWTHDFSIDAGEVKTDTFYFRVTDVTGQALGIAVPRICIKLMNGDHWPGYETSDVPTSGSGQLVNQYCEAYNLPSGLDLTGVADLQTLFTALWNTISQWAGFLAAVWNNVWFCFAAPLINTLGAGISGIQIGFGDLGRWLAAEIGASLYLIGYALKAIIGAVLASIIGWIAALFGVDAIKWLFDLFGYGQATGDILTTLLAALAALLGQFIGIVLAIVQATIAFVTGLLAAVNVAPQDIGFPNCGNPSDPLIEICHGLGLMDTMLQHDGLIVVQTICYTLLGLVVVNTIFWTIRRAQETLNVNQIPITGKK
jgi:hypothetical protein